MESEQLAGLPPSPGEGSGHRGRPAVGVGVRLGGLTTKAVVLVADDAVAVQVLVGR
jgi:hypothetical protein